MTYTSPSAHIFFYGNLEKVTRSQFALRAREPHYSRLSCQSFLVLFVQFDTLTDVFDVCTSPHSVTRRSVVVGQRKSDQHEGPCAGQKKTDFPVDCTPWLIHHLSPQTTVTHSTSAAVAMIDVLRPTSTFTCAQAQSCQMTAAQCRPSQEKTACQSSFS